MINYSDDNCICRAEKRNKDCPRHGLPPYPELTDKELKEALKDRF